MLIYIAVRNVKLCKYDKTRFERSIYFENEN